MNNDHTENDSQNDSMPSSDDILSGYQNYLLTNGKRPQNVAVLAKSIDFSEEGITKHFETLEKIESALALSKLTPVFDSVHGMPDGSDNKTEIVTQKLSHLFFSAISEMNKDRALWKLLLQNEGGLLAKSGITVSSAPLGIIGVGVLGKIREKFIDVVTEEITPATEEINLKEIITDKLSSVGGSHKGEDKIR
jgi:hypothetical protein